MKRLFAGIAMAALVAGCSTEREPDAPTSEPASTATSQSQSAEPVDQRPKAADTLEAVEEGDVAVDDEVIEGEGMDLPTWSAADGPTTWVCTETDMEGGPDPAGAVFRITVPVDETHESIVMMEDLRNRLGVEEKPEYLLVEIDATKIDRQNANVASVEWATTDYESISAESAWTIISSWTEGLALDNNSDIDLYNEGVEVNNALLESSPNRGAKGYDLMIVNSPIESMVAPAVIAGGFSVAPCELSNG